MLLSEILSGYTVPQFDTEIAGICCDSSKVRRGDVFIALRGEHVDGNNFISEAISAGAAAVITDRANPYPASVTVDDAGAAASIAFSNYYGRPSDSMTVVAVTGTNGKTSTVSALSHILNFSGRHTSSLGTVEFTVDGVDIDKEEFFGHSSTMTTPDVEGLYRALAFARDAGCDTFVMEASSHALAARRLDGMKVDVGAFTNLSSEHLDRHGDMESYFRAKSSLADLSDIFIVNCDDKYGMRMFDSCINSFGVSADKDLIGKMAGRLFASAENVSLLADGVEYDFYYEGGCARIFSPTPGRFALYNTLLAASIALSLGVSPGSISGALQTFRGAPGRMERISGGAGVPEVLIDYAHTPDALEKAMRDVRETHNGRRLIVLFGCGGDRDKSKRALMGRAAGRLADTVIITGDNPRGEDPDAIIEDILKGVAGSNVKVIPDREEALCFAVEISSERDVILCCGKGHEKYIIDKCGKHYFDEKAILTRELQRKYGKDYKKSL